VRRDEGTLPIQIDEAIETIAELERHALAETPTAHRAIQRLMLAIGRPRAAIAVLAVILAWIATNVVLGALHRAPLDPPPFPWLQSAATLAALLMTVLILTSENRQSEMDEQRARLHLQISLLAERKAAKVIELLQQLRHDLPQVPDRPDREAQEAMLPTDPHALAAELERRTPGRGELPEG
jgi:uncharacterized membrane protein